MSTEKRTNPEPEIPDNTTVTLGMLEQYMAKVIELQEARTKKQFDAFSNGLSEQISGQIDQKLEPVITALNQHTEVINSLARMPQQNAQNAAKPGKPNIKEIVNDLGPVLDFLRDQGIISRPASNEPLDKIAQLVKRRYERRIADEAAKDFSKWVKHDSSFGEEVASVMGDSLDSHQPV